MAHCSVVGCSNSHKNRKNKISFHALPKDEFIAKKWMNNINRESLPIRVYVCSNHFEKDCFDPSHELKQQLVPEYRIDQKRRLLKDAVPTIFPIESIGKNERKKFNDKVIMKDTVSSKDENPATKSSVSSKSDKTIIPNSAESIKTSNNELKKPSSVVSNTKDLLKSKDNNGTSKPTKTKDFKQAKLPFTKKKVLPTFVAASVSSPPPVNDYFHSNSDNKQNGSSLSKFDKHVNNLKDMDFVESLSKKSTSLTNKNSTETVKKQIIIVKPIENEKNKSMFTSKGNEKNPIVLAEDDEKPLSIYKNMYEEIPLSQMKNKSNKKLNNGNFTIPLKTKINLVDKSEDEEIPLSKVKKLISTINPSAATNNGDQNKTNTPKKIPSKISKLFDKTPKKTPNSKIENRTTSSSPARQSSRIRKNAEHKKIQEEIEMKRMEAEEEQLKLDTMKRLKEKRDREASMQLQMELATGKTTIKILDTVANQPKLKIKPLPVSPAAAVRPQLFAPNPNASKHIVIAIDMEPEKWKALSQLEQQKIIQQKRLQAQKHFQTLSLNALAQPKPIQIVSPRKSPLKISPMYPMIGKSNVYSANQKIISSSPLKSNPAQKFILKPILQTSPSQTIVQPYVAGGKMVHNYMQPIVKIPPVTFLKSIPGTTKTMIHPSLQQQTNAFTHISQQKVEDTNVFGLIPLPRSKKLPLPMGITSKEFGDVAMIVEFVNTFQRFLMSEDDFRITSTSLMTGLTSQGKDTDIVSNVLLLFLRVVLGNEDYKIHGLRMELADLPLTEFTVSYLLCQFIKSQIAKKKKERRAEEIAAEYAMLAEKARQRKEMMNNDAGNDEEADDLNDSALIEESLWMDDGIDDIKKKKKLSSKESTEETKLQKISTALENKEFYELPTVDQLFVINYILNLILESEDILSHYDELASERQDAFRNQDTFRKDRAKLRRQQEEEKQKKAMTMVDYAKPIKEDEETSAKSDEKLKEEDEVKDDKKVTEVTEVTDKEENKTKEKVVPEEEDEKKELEEEEENDEDIKKLASKLSDDPYLGMTQRQIDAIKSEAEKEATKKKEDAWYKLEEIKEKERAEEKKLAKAVIDILRLSKRTMRVEPLGYDRYFRMYWLFTEGIPGLYVEERSGYISTPNSDTTSGIPVGRTESWTYYNTMEDVKKLITSLTMNGIRESHLRTVLRSKYQMIESNLKELSSPKTAAIKATINSFLPTFPSTIETGPAKDAAGEIKSTTESSLETKKLADKSIVIEDDGDVIEIDSGNDETKEKVEIKNKEDTKQEKSITSKEKVLDEKEKSLPKVEEKNKKEDKHEKETNEKDISPSDELYKNTKNNSSAVPEQNKVKVDDSKSNDSLKDSKAADSLKDSVVKGEMPPLRPIDKTVVSVTQQNDTVSTSENNIKNVDYDPYAASMDALKTDLIESAKKISCGSLGDITNLDTLVVEVNKTLNLQDLKQYILQIQSCIFQKFFLAPMDGTNEAVVGEWCKAVEKATTLSRMHTLYGILENSVKWEKSVENVRCKVCRRIKGSRDDDRIVTCDYCNLGYHSYCLRPPLLYLPEGKWKCPTCMTSEERGSRRGKRVQESVEKAEKSESEHEELCHVCNADGLMILCDTCPKSFHFDCHNPPLRHTPRGNWSCQECRHPKKKTKKGGKRGRHVDTGSSSSDSSSDTEPDEYVAKRTKKTNNTKAKNNKKGKTVKQNNKRKQVISTSDSEDFENEPKKKKTESGKKGKSGNTTDEWSAEDKNKLSPTTLGNKRPRYAKDGLKNGKQKKSQANSKSSDNTNPDEIQGDRNERRARRNKRDGNVELKACKDILLALRKHKDAWPFLQAVDLTTAPDYSQIVKRPMDLGSILEKLDLLQYEDVLECIEDIKLVFQNSKDYNSNDSVVGVAGIKLHKEFDRLIKEHLPGLAG